MTYEIVTLGASLANTTDTGQNDDAEAIKDATSITIISNC